MDSYDVSIIKQSRLRIERDEKNNDIADQMSPKYYNETDRKIDEASESQIEFYENEDLISNTKNLKVFNEIATLNVSKSPTFQHEMTKEKVKGTPESSKSVSKASSRLITYAYTLLKNFRNKDSSSKKDGKSINK